MLTHIFRTARATNFKFGTQMEDNDPLQPQAPCPPRSKVKVARSCDQCKAPAGGGIPCRPNPAATLLVGNGTI